MDVKNVDSFFSASKAPSLRQCLKYKKMKKKKNKMHKRIEGAIREFLTPLFSQLAARIPSALCFYTFIFCNSNNCTDDGVTEAETSCLFFSILVRYFSNIPSTTLYK